MLQTPVGVIVPGISNGLSGRLGLCKSSTFDSVGHEEEGEFCMGSLKLTTETVHWGGPTQAGAVQSFGILFST